MQLSSTKLSPEARINPPGTLAVADCDICKATGALVVFGVGTRVGASVVFAAGAEVGASVRLAVGAGVGATVVAASGRGTAGCGAGVTTGGGAGTTTGSGAGDTGMGVSVTGTFCLTGCEGTAAGGARG